MNIVVLFDLNANHETENKGVHKQTLHSQVALFSVSVLQSIACTLDVVLVGSLHRLETLRKVSSLW